MFAKRLLLSPLLTLAPCFLVQASPNLVLGVMPYTSPVNIETSFAPLAGEISTAAGSPVSIQTRSSYRKFQAAMGRGKFDLVFTNGFDYVIAGKAGGYRPLVKFDKMLPGVFISRLDSPISRLEQLAGARVAMPPPEATYSLLAKHALLKHGVNPYRDLKIIYSRTNQSAIHKLLLGDVDAAATNVSELAKAQKNMAAQVRIFFTTRPVPTLLIATGTRVNAEQRERIAAHLTDSGNPVLDKFYRNPATHLGRLIAAQPGDFEEFQGLWETLLDQGETCCRSVIELP